MVSVVALVAWQRNSFLVLAGLLVFGCLDGLYLTSALLKVPKGAWTTLAFAFVLSGIFALWRFGKEQQWRAEGNTAIPFDRLVATAANGAKVLEPAYGGGELTPIRGTHYLFYFFPQPNSATPFSPLHDHPTHLSQVSESSSTSPAGPRRPSSGNS